MDEQESRELLRTMRLNPQGTSLAGEEKENYLCSLDGALRLLGTSLAQENPSRLMASVLDFGKEQKWNWKRLDKPARTFSRLSALVERVRQEYRWFAWIDDEKDSTQNKGYFETIDVSRDSGLPWTMDFTSLDITKQRSRELLAKLPSYLDLGQQLRQVLREDYIPVENVEATTTEIHKKALRRQFLEQLQESDLLGWQSAHFSLPPQAEKILSLGGEELWNISYVRFDPGSSLFQLYVIDVWQDIREPQIREKMGKTEVSPLLTEALKFGKDAAAWFILKEIDENFKSLHPVHVSRGLIGPYENKYLTKPDKKMPMLAVTKELLELDPDAQLLRFNRQYTYAPNHFVSEKEKEMRQEIYRENWHDTYIVVAAKHAAQVSKSIEGTNVRILQL